MNKEAVKPWVKALRSGKYKQIINSLEKSTGLCCLGVLCKIAPTCNVGEDKMLTGATLNSQDEVMGWSGLGSPSGRVGASSISLVRLNDGYNAPPKTFSEIADFIEEHWEQL